MASAVEALWRQALKTFSGCTSSSFQLSTANFERLKTLMNGITAKDVYLNSEMLDYVKKQEAPMCVIHMFENQDITIAIFILKQGSILPIHDHPRMYGLLKVISGVVKVDAYTFETSSDVNKEEDKYFPAIKHSSEIVRPNDTACVLEPRLKNLHGITSIEGPAAFLDILSPPYYSDSKLYCSYFKVVNTCEKSDKVQLVITDCPPNFYSRSLRYIGPPLR